MLSIIIYIDSHEHIESTIKSVFLATPTSLLTEIILVDDTGTMEYVPGDVRVKVLTNIEPVGRAISRNRGANAANGEILVFLHHTSKPEDDWVVPIVELIRENERSLVGTMVRRLDTNLWQSESGETLKWSWRWDLSLYRTYDDNVVEAVCVSNECLALSRSWFNELGGFDEQARNTEQQELCLRVWLCGGRCVIARDAGISTSSHDGKQDGVAAIRLAEAWFGNLRSRFYSAAGVVDGAVEYGTLGQLSRARDSLQTRDLDWFIERFQPELGKIFNLRGRYSGMSVAVVCDGPSLDKINRWNVVRHDLVVAVDYVADLFPCDFIICHQQDPIRQLLLGGKHTQNKFVVPVVLLGPDGRGRLPSRQIIPGSTCFELAEPDTALSNLDPPFINFGATALTAVQFAAFLGAREIVMYGWDCKLVNGMSHTTLINHYANGRYWAESELTGKRFVYYSDGLEKLQRLLSGYGINLLKMSYA